MTRGWAEVNCGGQSSLVDDVDDAGLCRSFGESVDPRDVGGKHASGYLVELIGGEFCGGASGEEFLGGDGVAGFDGEGGELLGGVGLVGGLDGLDFSLEGGIGLGGGGELGEVFGAHGWMGSVVDGRRWFGTLSVMSGGWRGDERWAEWRRANLVARWEDSRADWDRRNPTARLPLYLGKSGRVEDGLVWGCRGAWGLVVVGGHETDSPDLSVVAYGARDGG